MTSQEARPYNLKFSSPLTELAFKARASFDSPSLDAWMGMSATEWKDFSMESAITRAKRIGFLRNVAVVVGN